MVKAYVFINSEADTSQEVASRFKEIEGVINAYVVFGNYDIVVEIMAETAKELRDLITASIRKVGHIVSTTTMVAVGD